MQILDIPAVAIHRRRNILRQDNSQITSAFLIVLSLLSYEVAKHESHAFHQYRIVCGHLLSFTRSELDQSGISLSFSDQQWSHHITVIGISHILGFLI